MSRFTALLVDDEESIMEDMDKKPAATTRAY